jgi:hypothetical protein
MSNSTLISMRSHINVKLLFIYLVYLFYHKKSVPKIYLNLKLSHVWYVLQSKGAYSFFIEIKVVYIKDQINVKKKKSLTWIEN